jgi:hypothetical protein
VESQIGYTGFDGSTATSFSADMTFNDDIQLIYGTNSDVLCDFTSAQDQWVCVDDGGSSGFDFIFTATTIGRVTDANGDPAYRFNAPSTDIGTFFDIAATFVVADGTGTQAALALDLAVGNPTGTGNSLYGLHVESMVGDANTNLSGIFIDALTPSAGAAGEVEAAIKIGDGWDSEILFDSTSPVMQVDSGNTGTFAVRDTSVEIFHVSSVVNTEPIFNLTSQLRVDGSKEGLAVEPILGLMNGSDTWWVVDIDVANVDHTGTGNTLNLLNIDAITGDANANLNAINIGALTGTAGAAGEVETAINIGDGWDFLINVADAAPIILFANNGTFGFQDAGSGALVFAIQDAGVVADGIVHTRAAATNNGSHYSAGRASSFAVQDGSDLAAFFRVDTFADAAHTSTGNDILAFHAETITSPDGDSTHSLLGGEGGWDYLIWNNAALGTDAWTTALDKTANAKSGTLRVEINGTLYHIQLYAYS